MFYEIVCLLQSILIGKLLYDRYWVGSEVKESISLTLVQNADETFSVEGDAVFPIKNGKLHVTVDSISEQPSSTAMIALNLVSKTAQLGQMAVHESSLPDQFKTVVADICADIPRLVNSVMSRPLPETNLQGLIAGPQLQSLTEKE